MAVSTIAGPAGTLHVDDGGKGRPPVVLLHAFSGNADHWTAQLTHQRKKRRAIAFDFRGHGRSEMPTIEELTVDRMADDVASVVNKLGLYDFVLVGHSIGGSVAIDYAAGHPDRVAGLVVIGAPGKVPDAQAKQILDSMKADYDKVTEAYWLKLLAHAMPKTRERIMKEMRMLPKDAGFALIAATFAFDPVPGMILYPGPKLAIVTGDKEQPHDLHRTVPDLPFRRIAGTSHWPHLDQPAMVNAILDAFIASQVHLHVEMPWRRRAAE
ncbi:MAG: alpha/beta hydrolase [Rhodospirillaceae bacterium]|nr:alpha/beta hydrolase [Rhodospirillaceae bacterium]